jgi:hypothetical protein
MCCHLVRDHGMSLDAAIAHVDQWKSDMMEEYGWYALYFAHHDESPTDFVACTYGFQESYKHLDVQVVMRMEESRLHPILVHIALSIKGGMKFTPGEVTGEILRDFNCKIMAAKFEGRDVLRIILPDKANNVEFSKMNPLEIYAKQYGDLVNN